MIGSRTCAAIALVSGAAVAQAQAPQSVPQSLRHPPACTDATTAGKHALTIDDVLKLRGEGLARVNPFGAYDVSPDGQRIAVQVKQRLVDVRSHATNTFFWLHADVGVYDINSGRQLALLDRADQGDSWASPFWSPSGRYIALTHVGPATLDRELYGWEVGRKAPVRLAPGALAASLRVAIGDPNGRAGAYAWIDSVTVIAITIPTGSGTLDADDPASIWPREWHAASTAQSASASIIDAHLPTSIKAAHSALGVQTTVWRIDVRTGERHALVTMPSLRGRTPRDILISRDRQWLAFTPDVRPIDISAGPVPALNRAETELLLINLHDGRILHPLPGRHVTLTRWSADDSTIGARLSGDTVVQVRRDGAVIRPAAPVISPARRPDTTRATAPDVHVAARPRVEVQSDGTGEHLLVHRGSEVHAVLTVDQDIAQLATCPRWYVHYTSGTGDTLLARVSIPPDYVSGRRYPVLVQMYPGTVHTDHDMREDTVSYVQVSTSWEPALFAAHGYIVVEPSIPLAGGGANRASQFSGDILPAIDSLIAFGVADPNRLAIDGISFGGYGTAMVIEQTHRFKAASTRNGLYNLASMYGQFGPPRRLADDAGEQLWAPGWAESGQGHLGVPPYGNWDVYQQASPLNNVQAVTTPVLIVSADLDYAAPMEQSEEWFTALNRLGKPVRFIRYAGEAHGNASAVDLRHLFSQMTQWFDGWLQPSPSVR